MKHFLLSVFFFYGCAKNSGISVTDLTQKPKSDSSDKVSSDTDQLTVSFDETNVIAKRGDLIHLHALLSRKISTPVKVNVILIEATAVYPRDFTGFISGNSHIHPVMISPRTQVGHFPRIAVTKQAACGGKFYLQLNYDRDQTFVLGEPSIIQINCSQ